MTALRSLLLVVLALAALAIGCGEDDAATAGGRERPTVVATTAFAADLVRGVAGEDAEVVQLVPDSANPHSYGASAKDRAQLEQADLVVAFGRGYEEGLPLDELDAPRVDLVDHAGELRRAGEEEHAGEEDHGDHARDPHVWLDPARMAAAAPALAEALAQADPGRAAAYRERARTHAARLRALDADLRDALAAVPAGRRKLVTSHEALGYFADRYDFELVAAPFGLAPEAQASAEDLAGVVRAVRAEDVPVVFAQQGDDPQVMRRIADETGVAVVDDLLVENPGPGAETYADAMRHTARRIAEALAP